MCVAASTTGLLDIAAVCTLFINIREDSHSDFVFKGWPTLLGDC